MRNITFKLLFALSILLIGISSLTTSSGLAQAASEASDTQISTINVPPRILPSPEIISLKDHSFIFATFGDSRTGEVTEDALNRAKYTSYTFKAEDVVEEGEKEFATYRTRLFDEISNGFKSNLRRQNSWSFDFALFSGDLVRESTDEYWNEARHCFVDKIEREDATSGSFFPVIGNHELWAGPEVEKKMGIKNATNSALNKYFETFPRLVGDTGYETTGLHYYAFFVDKSVFVTLCTGNMVFDGCIPNDGDGMFLCEQATMSEQMDWFRQVLDYGIQQKDIRNVFVQYHKPSFSCAKHPPLQQCCDPLNVMSDYKSEFNYLNMFVFNGHNHTTEIYRTDDGITVLVAGGGAAPQKEKDNNRDWSIYKDTPKELFWDSLKPHINKWQKRINYFLVYVSDDDITIRERVLTNGSGFYRFEEGIVISKDGEITAPDRVTGVLE